MPQIIDLRGALPVRGGAHWRNPYPPRDLSAVNSVTIHYTAGPETQTFFNIASYQVGPQAQADFPGIAYHLGVDRVGDFHYLQDLDRRVWHSAAPGANETSIGIVFTGLGEPNPAQKIGLRRAILWCQEQLGRSLYVFGHKDRYATSCPGSQWPTWRPEILP